jgi:hypothetical protein
LADKEFRMRSKELTLFRMTPYQEWQVVGEIMIGRQGVQDEVQGVEIVKNNSFLPRVAGSG